jgi:hypothetical protein
MRTSLNKIKQAEDFLSGKLSAGDSLVFRAKMLIDPILRLNVTMQKKTYTLIRVYGRRKIKDAAEAVHKKIFNDPERIDYHQKITELFSKS